MRIYFTFRGSSPPPPAGGFGGGRATNLMFWVYAVYNSKFSKIYIGQTKNLERRLTLHNTREFKRSFTSRFESDWVLIYKESHESRLEALKREKQLKSYRGRQFIKQYIPG